MNAQQQSGFLVMALTNFGWHQVSGWFSRWEMAEGYANVSVRDGVNGKGADRNLMGVNVKGLEIRVFEVR